MKKTIIVGAGDLAEIVFFQIAFELGGDVAAFAVTASRRTTRVMMDRPVVSLEDVPRKYPPEDFDAFVAIGYADGNRARQSLIAELKSRGYRLPPVVSPGVATHGKELAENISISAGAVIQPYCDIGAGTIVRAGAILPHHGTVGDACYIGPGAVVGGRCHLGQRVFLGLGARVRDGLTIADDVSVGMASVVTKDLIEPGRYLGSPARKIG